VNTFVTQKTFPASSWDKSTLTASAVVFQLTIYTLRCTFFAVFSRPWLEAFAFAGVAVVFTMVIAFVILSLVSENALEILIALTLARFRV